jgi:hypothetical protein
MNVVPWSERDRAAGDTVLGRVTAGATVITTLTDELIVALDGLETTQASPLPWLTEQATSAVSSLAYAAIRALLAAEVVRPGEVVAPDCLAIEAGPDITGVLVLRRTASALLMVERTTTQGTDWSLTYQHGDTALEERISAGGFHVFSVMPLSHLGDHLADFFDPAGQVNDTEVAPRQFDTPEAFAAQAAAVPALAEATVVCQTTVAHHGSDEAVAVAVYASPAGVFTLTGGRRTGPDDAAHLTLNATNPAALRALPLTLLSVAGAPNV